MPHVADDSNDGQPGTCPWIANALTDCVLPGPELTSNGLAHENDIRRAGTDDSERVLQFRPHGDDWIRKLQSMRAMAEPLLAAAAPEGREPARFVAAGAARLRDDRGSGGPSPQEI